MAVEKQLMINAPADKVFSYIADFPRHSEWAQHKLKVDQTSQGPVGQGTTYKSVGHEMGRDNEDTVTIAEFVPNQKLVFEVQGNAGHFRHWFQLKPADGGAELAKGFEVLKANFPFSLLLPVAMLFMVPGGLNGDLKRIKAKVEGS